MASPPLRIDWRDLPCDFGIQLKAHIRARDLETCTMHSTVPVLRGVSAAALIFGLFTLPARAGGDPPVFGPVGIVAGQTLRMNVFCYPHDSVLGAAQPCVGELMIHDPSGGVLTSTRYALEPGQSSSLEFALPEALGSLLALLATPRRLEIEPCWEPDPTGGVAIPSAEVVDTASGRTAVMVPAAAARLSLLRVAG
jgi:hypothetical protein